MESAESDNNLALLEDLFNEEPEFQACFDLLGSGNNRFEEYSNEDVAKFINNMENRNTLRKTTGDLKLFHRYLEQNGEGREPHELPPEELSTYVSRFLLSVRKKDGSDYEPSSLRGFFSSIDRHLKRSGYQFSMVKDQQFSMCRKTLKCKQKQLKSSGKGNKPRVSDELTDEDIEQLYVTGQLGMHSPTSLINSLWLINMLHFGMRGGVEQHSLKWGDIRMETDTDGRQYIIYTQERQTKTRTGENPRDIRKVKPRAYATPENPDRDPVATYLEYSMRRPEKMRGPDDAFFLSINDPSPSPGQQWFKCQNMGINKIYGIMKNMKINTNLPHDKHLTNHSARKHLIQKLNDNNIPPNQIIQISGHRNLNSVNNYSTLNTNQQASISHILSNTNKTVAPVASNQSPPHNRPQLPSSQPSCSLTTKSNRYSHLDTRSLFQGSTFNNSVIHVYCQPTVPPSPASPSLCGPPAKYRRILPLPEDDSDTD